MFRCVSVHISGPPAPRHTSTPTQSFTRTKQTTSTKQDAHSGSSNIHEHHKAGRWTKAVARLSESGYCTANCSLLCVQPSTQHTAPTHCFHRLLRRPGRNLYVLLNITIISLHMRLWFCCSLLFFFAPQCVSHLSHNESLCRHLIVCLSVLSPMAPCSLSALCDFSGAQVVHLSLQLPWGGRDWQSQSTDTFMY